MGPMPMLRLAWNSPHRSRRRGSSRANAKGREKLGRRGKRGSDRNAQRAEADGWRLKFEGTKENIGGGTERRTRDKYRDAIRAYRRGQNEDDHDDSNGIVG